MKTEAKLRSLEGEQGFKEIWPSDLVFEPDITLIQIWPRNYSDKYSGKVSWRLKQNCAI